MICDKCGYTTSNKLRKTCIRESCTGKMIKNTEERTFSVMKAYRKKRK